MNSIFARPALPAGTNEQQAVESEIEAFDRFFTAQGNEPLSRQESALLRTYLLAKVRGLIDVKA